MIWVCRAGNGGSDYGYFVNSKKIFLSWNGYKVNLSSVDNINVAKSIVLEENEWASKTAISTWASQMVNFVRDMQIGDFVFIPSPHSKDYCLCRIISDYNFSEYNDKYYHYRDAYSAQTAR